MNFQEAIDWLYSAQMHGIKLGLDNIQRLTEALGIRTAGPGALKFIHVAGTNGKGSTCALIDSICRAAGIRTGLYTSPHLVSFRERVRIDGAMISETDAAAGLTRIRDATAGWAHSPTFFEIATALALAYFQERQVEVVVLETGMGGRLDATNVVTPAVSVITPIYLDHQQWLGSTLPEIALEKAGIIKPGVPVVCAWQRDEVLGILGHMALHRDSPFHVVVSPLRGVEIGLAGDHQKWNAALAVHALHVAGFTVSDSAMAAGLRDVQWPGRFQRIDERIVLDGAHNPAAARRLSATWREVYGEERATLVLSILGDKDARGIIEALAPIASRIIAVPVQNARSSTSEALIASVREIAPDIPCSPAADFVQGLEAARQKADRILITGSLFLVGEALAHFEGTPHETSVQ